MSESAVNGSGVASKDMPIGWQVNVGNLGASVQLRRARLSFVKAGPQEPPAIPPSETQPASAQASPDSGLLKGAAVANAGLGGLSLISAIVASAGDTPGALVAVLFGATAAMFANAGLLFTWERKK